MLHFYLFSKSLYYLFIYLFYLFSKSLYYFNYTVKLYIKLSFLQSLCGLGCIGDYEPHSLEQFSFYVLFYIHRWWEKTQTFQLKAFLRVLFAE